MPISKWARLLAQNPTFKQIQPSEGGLELQSAPMEVRPLIVANQFPKFRKILIATATHERALVWQAKLGLLGVNENCIHQLPGGISSLFEDSAPESVALSDRLGALRALVAPEDAIIISAGSAPLERTLPQDVLIDAFMDFRVGNRVDAEQMMAQFRSLGYEPSEPVRIPGQFSKRGGIIDVFASGHNLPVRIELFDDEIESIRHFDPSSQRSIASVDSLNISPSRETIFGGGEDHARELILQVLEMEAAQLTEEAGSRLEELVRTDADLIAQQTFFDRLDLYRPLLYPDSGCALDLLGEEGLLVIDEGVELETYLARAEEELADVLRSRAERGEILKSTASDFLCPVERLGSQPKTLALSQMNVKPDWLMLSESIDVGGSSLEPYRGRPQGFTQALTNWLEQGSTVVISTDQPNRAKSVLSQIDLVPSETVPDAVTKGLYLTSGNLGGGFVMPSAGIAVVTDAELFGVARLKLPQKKFSEGIPVATVLDLKPGDYVVHINFGIGRFRGLTKRVTEGVEKEFLLIEYAPPDKLFVPADQLDRIQKYLNPGDATPKINRLTGGEWQRTITKAKEDARAFATDLVKLYAERQRVQRRPFGPDTPWQTEMEATFPWVETKSQMRAIQEAKADLRREFPMDRLVCGDVGFGKTEVAIRAAFKVAQEGRQVAVLCPTTILSEQHFRNFSDRLSAFPIRLGLLNRFRTNAERNEILDQLASGEIDIVIGTHALLTKEIEFKDLGLVIIDEEQKFGVKQKESLKHLRTQVDVLTLSATPIPRTLSMALMDIRQMSLINDPPPGRLPIRTFLRPYGGEVVREAILREMARGGQVFYVYNRVEGIQHVAERLKKLVPMAKIGIGHGQMTEKELEPVMIGFIKGELDILLSTTIIENGIDISNANTLIVENADRLGLAQLYQLRGRVGRSDVQAYAYLLYESHKDLSDTAMQRLQALQEFSSLGSGYSLAFRDLQIRGAGELLGAKQHGAMAAVGYELYTQLIAEAVESLKNAVDGVPRVRNEVADPLATLEPLPTLDLPAVALIPDSYIADQSQRLYFYQQMMSSRTLDALGEVRKEIEDRYGHAPQEVANAFAIMHFRIVCDHIGVSKIDGAGGRLAVTFKDRTKVPPRIFTIMARFKRDAYLSRDVYVWPFSSDPLSACDQFLEAFKTAKEEYEAALAELI